VTDALRLASLTPVLAQINGRQLGLCVDKRRPLALQPASRFSGFHRHDSKGFSHFTQGKAITITGFELYAVDVSKHHSVGDQTPWDADTTDLGDKNKQAFTFTAPEDTAEPKVLTRTSDTRVFLIIRYALST